jgi:hypothetical protein
MTITLYNPEKFLETAVRGLKDYAEEGFRKSVRDDGENYVGDQLYEIIMEFPSTADVLRLVPLPKVLIHFEIDDIDDRILGFGDGIVVDNYDPLLMLHKPQEAGEHRINLDVGIWCSSRSGGLTARMRAYQTLRNLFQGPLAHERLKTATTSYVEGVFDGCLEILEFSGGRFYQEEINDIPVFRLINCQLVIRCFSRTPIDEIIPSIEEVTQIPELIIDDNLQLPMGSVAKDYGVGVDSGTKT